MKYIGHLRVYFNHRDKSGMVWCVATESWCLDVQAIQLIAIDCTSHYVERERDPFGPPSAWFECYGELTVFESGVAVIKGCEAV